MCIWMHTPAHTHKEIVLGKFVIVVDRVSSFVSELSTNQSV